MKKKLARTNNSNLTDVELTLLDVMALFPVDFEELQAASFQSWNNWPFNHGLTDAELLQVLNIMIGAGILETYHRVWEGRMWKSYVPTQQGGLLWERERCPIWEKYFDYRFSRTRSKTDYSWAWSPSRSVLESLIDTWASAAGSGEIIKPGIVDSGERTISWKIFSKGFLVGFSGKTMSLPEKENFKKQNSCWSRLFDDWFSRLDSKGSL